MNNMLKKILKLTIVFILVLCSGCIFISCKSSISNDQAQGNKDDRTFTIINDTGEIINEVKIFVGEGTELEHAYQKNPDASSFSIKISEDYKEYTDFKVILIDRYGLKYEKEVSNVPQKGRTEVKITEDDYVEQKGDLKKKIDQFFN